MKRQFLLMLISVIAGLATFAASQIIFRNAAITTDEHAYVMQAYTYSEGEISRPLPPAPEFFKHEMMIMDRDVGWLSRYPPGHSIWLIPGVLLGQPRIMVSVAAALSVYIFGNIGFLLQFSPGLLPLLLLISPYFIFMNGTLLSHTSGLPAAGLMLSAYIYWKKKQKFIFALFAGLAWSLLFLNRTFTGLLIALPFALDALWDLYKKRDMQTLFATLLFVVSASMGVGAYLLYNYLAVGDPLLPTYLYYAPSEKLGFGVRHEGIFPVTHTFFQGLTYLWENLVLLDKWLFGFRGSLLAALALAIWGWHQRWSLLCLTAIISVLTGYIFFWFEGIKYVGPVYYFELLPFILLAAGFGVQKIIIFPVSHVDAKKVVYAFGLLFFITMSLGFMWKEGKQLRSFQSIIGQYQHVASTAPENSLILVEMFDGLNSVYKGTSFNPRGLDSDPLMVAAGKQHPAIILDVFPDREAYHLYRESNKLVLAPYINSEPIGYRCNIVGMAAQTGTNEKGSDGTGIRVAREGKDDEGLLVFGDKRLLSPGHYQLTVDVQVTKAVQSDPLSLTVIADDGPEVLASKEFDKQCECRPYTLDFFLKTVTNIECRIYYGGKGDVSVGDIGISKITK